MAIPDYPYNTEFGDSSSKPDSFYEKEITELKRRIQEQRNYIAYIKGRMADTGVALRKAQASLEIVNREGGVENHESK